jgi:hypothetical protein
VTADNLTTVGSSGDIDHTVSSGSYDGDYVLYFDPESGEFRVDSFRSTNTVTGSGSENTATVTSTTESIVEIQNDGRIQNTVGVEAITGQNDATQNTGNASIATGDANVAATLFNFLNANVVDGALWLEVADIFGDLNGNVVIPEEAIAYLERRQRELLIHATNSQTGSGSTNELDIDVTNMETTTLRNTADAENNVAIDAITGQNEATQNTGGAAVTTGDVEATTNTVTLANMNVVDGNLGLVIVNAFNRWLAYLLGSDGSWTPIGHSYSTVITAENRQTGADSTNTVDVDVTNTAETTIENDASITNTLEIAAITGQNTANQNTGNASVTTGDARVSANIVNVVNTNVVRGSLFIAVVNVFGNWFGDFLFGGRAIGVLASSGGGATIAAQNTNTGAESTNTIDVDANSESTLAVDNTATIENTLVVNADTGHNEASRNTGLASIDTGDVLVALHARNVANITLADISSPWVNITADLLNSTTGADSTNTIDVTVNDERHVTVVNDAAVDTAMGIIANTGFNLANRNTLGGMVATGLAQVSARVENLLNQTWLVGDEYGDDPRYAGVHIAAANEETGADSINANTVDPSVSTTVNITNGADVNNTAEVAATTGNNEARENTGGGAVGSGNEVNRNTGTLRLSDGEPSDDGGTPASGGNGTPPSGVGGGATLPSSAGSTAGPSSSGWSGNGGGTEEAPVVARRVPARVQGAQSTLHLAAAVTPRISAIGPVARLPFGPAVAQAADVQGESEKPTLTPSRFPTSGSNGSLLDTLERSWPWTFLVAALALLLRLVGGRGRLAEIFVRWGRT